VLVLLVAVDLALWPGTTAGVVDWNTAWLWPDLVRLSAEVRSLVLIGVAGATGGAWREMRRRMTAAASESIYTAGISAMQIVFGGMTAVVGWLVVGTVLLGATNSSTGLIGVNAFGLVALAVLAGYFGPEMLRLFSEKQLEVFRGRGKQDDVEDRLPEIFRAPTPVMPTRPELASDVVKSVASETVKSSSSTQVIVRSTELVENTPTITILESVQEQWERHPDDPQIARQLVDLLRARGQIDEAAHVFDSLIDAHPGDAELVRQKASLYLEVGDQRRYYETVQAAEEISARDTFRDNVGKPITLTGIEFRDLPFFGNFTWELQPNVNVLLGRNGYGKSHLLRAVVGMLQNDRTVTGQFFAARSGRGSRPLMRVDVTKDNTVQSIERSRLVFEKQFGAVPLLAIPDMRYIEKSDDSFAPVAGALDLSRQGATHFLQERSFQGLILTFLYELCREFDKHHGFDRPIFRLMQNVVQGLTDRSFTFLDVVELDNAGFRILVATDGNESNPLPLQKASQGTLSVLSMVGLVYRFLKSVHTSVAEDALTKQPGIVVIDEIDAHLHPLWQQQILQLFRDTFPNVQFIVTAHTPLVVAGCKKREVAVLQKGTGGFTVHVKEEHFIGATAESLYRRVFDVDDKDVAYLRLNSLQARAPEFRKRVEELQDRPTLSAAESAELDDLEEKLFYLDEAEHIATERAQAATFTRDRQRIEMELRNQEGKVAELQNQVSSLKEELDTAQGESTEETPPS